MSRLPENLRSPLVAFDRRQRVAGAGADLARLVGIGASGLAVLFLADYHLALSWEWRLALLLAFGALVVALSGRLILRALRGASLPRLAVQFENRAGVAFRSRLVTAVELLLSGEGERFGYSQELLGACAGEAAALASRVDPRTLIDREPLRRAARRATVLVLAALSVGYWGRDALVYIGGRYAGREPAAGEGGQAKFEVSPGNARIAEGSDLTLTLKLTGTDRFPRLVRAPATGDVPLRHDGVRFVASLTGVTESFDYYFEAGPFRSVAHHVEVVRPPALKRLVLRYRYPAYTGMAEETQEHGSHDIVAPVGTRVELSGESTTPVTSVCFLMDGQRRVPARSITPTRFDHAFEILKNGTYAVELVGTEGFANHAATQQIAAIEDRPPLVYVLEPGKDLSVAVADMTSFPLKLFISDDYGAQSAQLHYTLAQRFEYTTLTSDHDEPIALAGPDPRKLTVAHSWDLRRRVFQPGDVVTYYVEAIDRMPGAKPHFGRSKSYTIRIPFVTDVYKEAAAEQDEQINTVEDLAKKQKEIDEKLAGAMKDIQRQDGQVEWKTRQQLETLAKQQQGLRKRAEEVSGRMEATLEKLQKNELVDAGTLDKLKEVQELFQQVADGRMKELMERMRDLMSQAKVEPTDLTKVRKDFDRQRYARELDRVLASLKKLKLAQEMQRSVKAAAELTKQQEELKRLTEQRAKEGKPARDLEQRQADVEKAAKSLLSNLDQLAADAEKSAPELSKSVREAAEEARKGQLEPSLDAARKQLLQSSAAGAVPHQKKAHNQMRSLEESLRKAQTGMKQKQTAVNLAKLLGLVRLGLDVSHVQETLTAEPGLDDPFSPASDTRATSRRLASSQSRVRGGLESFERGFAELISDEAIFKSSFVSAVSELIETAREAVDAFEAAHVHSGRQLASQGLEKLNRVVAKLIEMVQQLMNQQQQAGMEGFFDQLEKLIEQQQKVNDEAERLRQQPGSNPLLQQMMERMAAEQSMVREAMEQLAAKYKEARDVAGDLDGIAREMKDVEDSLRRFDNTDATRQKQKQVLYRMLEADKSIRKQGESKKRVARIARDYAPTAVDPVEKELTEVRQKLFHNLSRESYPVEHRDLVERYLRSIAQ